MSFLVGFLMFFFFQPNQIKSVLELPLIVIRDKIFTRNVKKKMELKMKGKKL